MYVDTDIFYCVAQIFRAYQLHRIFVVILYIQPDDGDGEDL
jgi:hypothetical protein